MTRVPELEERNLRYLGDDLIAGMAVFVSERELVSDRNHHVVWYGGSAIVEASSGNEIPDSFCD